MRVAILTRDEFFRARRRILELLSEGPVEVEVSSEVAPVFTSFLEDMFILYSAAPTTDGTVLYTLVLPEHYFRLDPRIEEYSDRFTDPRLVREAVRMGRIAEVGMIESPRQLVRVIRELSLAGKHLLLMVSTRLPVRAAILFVSGRVRAAWVETLTFVTGRRALRQMMYYGPYKYVLIDFPG